MREILFRGKRVDNGEWVYGYYSEFPMPSLGCIFATGTDEYIACEDIGSYIVKIITKQHPYFSNANPIQVCEFEKYEVIPETVGQYTGLTDKNGVKIFEGDILRWIDHNQHKGRHVKGAVVMWAFGWAVKNIFNSDYENWSWSNNTHEVIGNIHDNPYLLEESK